MIDQYRCQRCVMDLSDPNIEFDSDGHCNHCRSYPERVAAQLISADLRAGKLDDLLTKIRAAGRNKRYDCVIGVSGGVDSSYVALLAKDFGLRVLLVHFDNGWNGEVAVKNVQNITDNTGFDLFTYVVDWAEFRDLQRSLFKASVIDIELVTDHAIKATLFKVASQFGVKYILNGGNVVTECIMPAAWRHIKVDKKNILDIHKAHGTVKLESYPMAGIIKQQFYKYIYRIKTVQILNYCDFDRGSVISRISSELGWQDYGGKHHESVFTRFYQSYILVEKFNVDKRKAHLSNLICAGQISRQDALARLESPVYDESLLKQDLEFVKKKLGFSDEEFSQYLVESPRSHYEYQSDEQFIDRLAALKRLIFRG